MTSEHLQQDLFNTMSLQEGFPVKTSVWQVEEKESQKNPDRVFFTNSCESYAWYDQSSSSWKTWQRSLITDWTSFSESFPKQGTMLNGQLYLRVHWEPVIEEAVGGSLPTPNNNGQQGRKFETRNQNATGQDTQIKWSTNSENFERQSNDGDDKRESRVDENLSRSSNGREAKSTDTRRICELSEETNNYQGINSQHNYQENNDRTLVSERQSGLQLSEYRNWKEIKPHLKTIQFDKEMTTIQTKEWTTKSPMLPTPTTMDYLPPRSVDSMIKQTQVHRKGRTKLANLREAVNPETVELFNHLQTLPTPTARDYKGRTSTKWNEKYGPKVIPDVLTQTGDSMSVSPFFLEEVMGYPIGWTELKH